MSSTVRRWTARAHLGAISVDHISLAAAENSKEIVFIALGPSRRTIATPVGVTGGVEGGVRRRGKKGWGDVGSMGSNGEQRDRRVTEKTLEGCS